MGLDSFVSVCHWKRGPETIFCTLRSMFTMRRYALGRREVVQHGSLYRRDFTTLTERAHDGLAGAMIAEDESGTRVPGLGARTRWPPAWPCDRIFAPGLDSRLRY